MYAQMRTYVHTPTRSLAHSFPSPLLGEFLNDNEAISRNVWVVRAQREAGGWKGKWEERSSGKGKRKKVETGLIARSGQILQAAWQPISQDG